MPVSSIKLADGLTENHQLALLKSIANPLSLNSEERLHLLNGIDLLRSSRVEIDGQNLSFAKFFESFIDGVYTDKFIEGVLASKQIYAEGQKHKKMVIAEIRARSVNEHWFRQDIPETRFLIAFCLYWWNALVAGYIFEAEVFRDLQDSGIALQAHDLRKRIERFSFADLTISEMKGDIKSSTYFFSAARSSDLAHDFYITRYYDELERRYHWFVILRLELWRRLDGETRPIIFPKWPENFSKPATFDFGGMQWVAVSYDVWKVKILALQQQGVQS
jgi:hypothetical protein